MSELKNLHPSHSESNSTIGTPNQIEVRGAKVNNLQAVDLNVPHGQWLAICGVSGSGKSSLALDTLYAEGQRRYIESFSPYTRQFLQQLDKPEADSIQGIPPAIAIRAVRDTRNRSATVGSATETYEHLRVLFSRVATAFCPTCEQPIHRDDPESASAKLESLPEGARYQIVFPVTIEGVSPQESLSVFQRHGFVRVIADQQTIDLSNPSETAIPATQFRVVVDRLKTDSPSTRVRDSLETAFQFGQGTCEALIATNDTDYDEQIDGRNWKRIRFTSQLTCSHCDTQLPNPEPNLFSYRSVLGACGHCHGTGTVPTIDRSKLVPNPRLSINEGAVAIWDTPKFKREKEQFLALADDLGIAIDQPLCELPEDQQAVLWDGSSGGEYDGIISLVQENFNGKQAKPTDESRWFTHTTCPSCRGSRLNRDSLAFRIGKYHIASLCSMEISAATQFLSEFAWEDWQAQIANRILAQVERRLDYLKQIGLGYLSLDRRLASLSSGEVQRIMLTAALGSTLINMLYVLDEPTTGLHSADIQLLIPAIESLHQRGNTVVCVDHHPSVLKHAERIVELGPDAGEEGGEVVFDGSYKQLAKSESQTGHCIAGKRGFWLPEKRRAGRGKMKLVGARGHNLKNIDVLFPLGGLCAISGVSGSGKSTLVQKTLYPALAQKQNRAPIPALPYDEMLGDNQIHEVVLIDQSPIGRSPRSNPVTYVKAYDDIRKLFAEQVTAKARNFTAGHFSFNVAKGRCPKCEGDGHLKIDMQFLSDLYVRCDSCRGSRFRSEILEVKHRGKNIAQVLEMPIGKAFAFFRGQPKVQAKLKTLMDVGLGYLSLGQPATTLSTGEAQRLKLALYLNAKTAKRCLFILDEPTAGLHMADVANLIETFDALIAVGHSIIVVEHNLQLLRQADWIVDLGPGAGEKGGQVVASGTPEELANHPDSLTGRYLKQVLTPHD